MNIKRLEEFNEKPVCMTWDDYKYYGIFNINLKSQGFVKIYINGHSILEMPVNDFKTEIIEVVELTPIQEQSIRTNLQSRTRNQRLLQILFNDGGSPAQLWLGGIRAERSKNTILIYSINGAFNRVSFESMDELINYLDFPGREKQIENLIELTSLSN